MKTLLLIRHAKSSWDVEGKDIDRPLNNRGISDAPAMAQRLLEKNVKLDFIVSSPAKRALTTAGYFAEAYGIKSQNILTVPALYEPTTGAFTNAIVNLDDVNNDVAIFSHNPGVTAFVNMLTATQIDDMPTCAIFAIKTDIKAWKDFTLAEKEFWFFDYPKAG